MLGNNTPHTDEEFFRLRKEGKIYISKAFKLSDGSSEIRHVKIVLEDSNIVVAGELNGMFTLRSSPKRKQQIAVLVSQDDKEIRRITLQRFDQKNSGDFKTSSEHSFTFRGDEFSKLLTFLKSIQFIDFSNKENFQIEDLSTNSGNKALIDSTEKDLINILRNVHGQERTELLRQIRDNLSKKDLDILLGRKEALENFRSHVTDSDWEEKEWQFFFREQKWIFGYGLDYRILTQFDREMNVSGVGTDNQEKVIVDFLMTFTDFTATVEIKKPSTPIFQKSKNRSGTWSFNSEFIDSVSQVLEQKAEWGILGQNTNLYNKSGSEKINKRTRDAKAILVIGMKSEFMSVSNVREMEIKQDTFELFRRGSRNIEIITYDELLERANFIVHQE